MCPRTAQLGLHQSKRYGTTSYTGRLLALLHRRVALSYKWTMSRDSAGVKFPPPLIFLVSILIALGLKRVWPMSVVPETVAMPMGVVFIVAAFCLALLGFRELRRHKTTMRPDEPSSAIVKSGPYRFTRNPLYVSLSALQLGIGLWTNNLWMVAMLLPVWVVMTTQVIAREEAYLERAFGDDYLAYKSTVRRWI